MKGEKSMEYKVNILWDNEASVWIATSDDVPGLVLESDSIDALKERVKMAIPELLTLNKGGVTNMTAFAANLIAKGEAQGMAQGEAKLAKLVSVLLAQKRTDDIERATGDEAYRQKLYKELNITE